MHEPGMDIMSRRSPSLLCLLLVTPNIFGCAERADRSDAPADSVTVYCSIDEQFARRILDDFQQETGIRLRVIFDSEAGKTTGLVNRIIAEASAQRPRADVFWSSELFHTIRLARMGLLVPYAPPTADDIPDRFKDSLHRWTGLAVRARVIAFDERKINPEEVPRRWRDLADPRNASRTTIANPLFGTTSGHISAMFALWGVEQGRTFLEKLRDGGVIIADGNSSAVRAVIAGRASLAATDTDDVWVAQRRLPSLNLVYPDLGDGGTLLIPCSVALIAGRPEDPAATRPAAMRLVDYLVSAKVETMLAKSRSRNIPVRAELRRELGIPWPPESKVQYEAIVDVMDEAMSSVREILLH